jgi:hypothetical protein
MKKEHASMVLQAEAVKMVRCSLYQDIFFLIFYLITSEIYMIHVYVTTKSYGCD